MRHLSSLVCKQQEVAGNFTPQQLFAFYAPNDTDKKKGLSGIPIPQGPSYIHPEMPTPGPHPLEKKIKKFEKQQVGMGKGKEGAGGKEGVMERGREEGEEEGK
jgi:hypothetical protein